MQIHEAAFRIQQGDRVGVERVIVGVNRFVEPRSGRWSCSGIAARMSRMQIDRLRALRAARDPAR